MSESIDQVTEGEITTASRVLTRLMQRLLTETTPPNIKELPADPVETYVDHRLVDEFYVADLIGSDRKTIRAMVARGELPAPIRVTEHRKRWRLGTVFAWIRERDQAAQAKQRRPTP